MSRSSVNVPNTVPPAATANVEDHDPYTDPRFRRHYEWLTQLDQASLRHYALVEGLINDFQFKELAALVSPTEHSAKLLTYIKPFGIASFSVLLKTLRKACPLGEERICKLEELCYPQVVEHTGNVQHETFLLSPKDKIDISRTSPNRCESSDRVKAELGAMRSCFENGSNASDEIVNYRLTPVPIKRRHDDLTESERKRVSTATSLKEEEKAHDLLMSSVSGRIFLDRRFKGSNELKVLLLEMEAAMERFFFDNEKFEFAFKAERHFKSTLISGSVNTLVTVVVDVEKGTDLFNTCYQQLVTALAPLLGVPETDFQILAKIPVNSVMMLIMMPVAAMLRFYDWALHAPAILESLGIMRFAALGRAVSVVVKPSALGTEAQVGIREADVLTHQNPTLLKRLESGCLLPPNVSSPGSMSVDEVLLMCGQYAFGDAARMQKLITVVQDVLVVVPSKIVQSASPFGVAGHEPDPVHGQQSAVEETSGDSVANNMETSSRNAGDSPKATSLRRPPQQVAAASAFSSGDPWKSEVYRRNHRFLIALDKVLFRNHSFTAGFINPLAPRTILQKSANLAYPVQMHS